IESLNQNALIIPPVNAMLDMDLLEHKINAPRDINGQKHALHVETISIKLDGQPDMDTLKSVFTKLTGRKYGNIMRAKALVQTSQGPYRFDLASGQVDMIRFNKDLTNSRLVIIGTGLQEEKIRELIG
ncbi:MAG: GTP-binding protein, partial [Nitrospirota bacterium]